MRNFKLTLVGLTLLSGLFCTNPLKAMTLVADSKRDFKPEQGYSGWHYGYDNGNGFQENLQLPWGEFNATGGIFNGSPSSPKMVRRWVSNFDGDVRFKIDFLGTSNSGIATEFLQQVLIDGKSVLLEASTNPIDNSSYKFGAFAVQKDAAIDFVFSPVDPAWQGQFNLEIEIEGEPNIANLMAPQQGLIFIKSPSGDPVHVGLLADDTVYEANPDTGFVQKQSFEQFIQGKTHEVTTLAPEVVERMVDEIEPKLGLKYSSPKAFPAEQKGANGEFTNVGLIEWALEEVGVEGGEGLIPQYIERISCNPFPGENNSCGTFSALNINNLYFEASGRVPSVRKPLEPIYSVPPSINPEEILTQNQSKNSIFGALEGVDFIITDPEGRRMGYTSNLGFFNEIPGVMYNHENLIGLSDTVLAVTSSAVDPVTNRTLTTSGQPAPVSLKNLDYCSQNSTPQGVFRFSIAQRLPGEYKIEKRTPINCTETQTVPEPSTLLGLATLGLLGMRTRQKVRNL